MLSIGKVGGGNADPRYYINTVVQGKDDYYSDRGEAPGTWHGAGAEDRGLDGSVSGDEFMSVLVEPTAKAKTVLAYDLTFSAPKSVSVLYGVGDREVSPVVRDAHDAAVRSALDYLERQAAWTRRGEGGHQVLRGEGLTVAMFRHRTSRAGDPQLHTHSVVANTTRAEGRDTALDGRALYAHGRTAGFLYQAELRKNLTETLGVEWEPVQRGVAEISGVGDDVILHFSRRSGEIKEQLARVGGRSARAAEIATLETRKTKDYNVPTERLREHWRSRAAEFGFGQKEVVALLDRRPAREPEVPDLAAVAERLADAEGVTEQRSTFDRRDVLREWAEAHREGVSVERAEQLADRWLGSGYAVEVASGAKRQHLGGARYSTPEMIAAEARVVESASDRRAAGVACVDAERVDDAFVGSDLSAEQREMVRRLTTSGDGVQVVRAAAGTGKTYALSAARDLWAEEGVRVYGVALAARAAVEMEATAGIDSTTIARFLRGVEQGNGVAPGSVLVVDEAGMVGTRVIDRLVQHTNEVEAKLVLVGDDRQLPEIDAGGVFRSLADKVGAIELHQVHRQAEAWDREALADLRRGDVGRWADEYRERGRVVARPNAYDLRNTLVDDWWEAARAPDVDAVMIAHRRADVTDLNALARDRMHRAGRLGEEDLEAGGRAFAVGDRVVTRHNNQRLGVVNGTRGEVVGLDMDQRSATVRTDKGEERELAARYLDEGWLDHAYALTAHTAQGATVDRSFVLGSDGLYNEWGYTALSRHREATRFYFVSPGSVERALPGLEGDGDPVRDGLVEMLGASHAKETAIDLLDRVGTEKRDRALAEAREELAAAERRAAALWEERQQLGLLQRRRRAALDREIGQQDETAARWSAEVDALVNEPVEQPRRSDVAPEMEPPDLDALRVALAAPDTDMVGALGARPDGFAAREAWLRAAAELVTHGAPAPDLTVPDPSLDGPGLDL